MATYLQPGPGAQRAEAAVARPQRDALHRAAPDQRAVDEPMPHELRPRWASMARDAWAGVQDAGACQQASRSSWCTPGTCCTTSDAAGILGDPALPQQQQRLPELAVPLDRIQCWGNKNAGDVARTTPAGSAAGVVGASRRRCTTNRWPAGAARALPSAGTRTRLTVQPYAARSATLSRPPGSRSTATPSATGICTSWARNSPT